MVTQQERDEFFMRRCLQLAAQGRQNAKPNPMVGAVIVSEEGNIIGEGYHVRCGEGHAEVNAFASVRPGDECLSHSNFIFRCSICKATSFRMLSTKAEMSTASKSIISGASSILFSVEMSLNSAVSLSLCA